MFCCFPKRVAAGRVAQGLLTVLFVTIGLQSLSAQTYTQVTLPITGLSSPRAVAVDGSGNLYIADELYAPTYRVLKVPAGGGTPVAVYNNANYPAQALAVDSSGNVFVAIAGPPYVLKISNLGVTAVGANWVDPVGLAVDAQNNVYVVDREGSPANGVLWKVASDGSGPQTQIPLNGGVGGYGVAVDSAGNVFVSNYGGIIEIPVNGGNLITVNRASAAYLTIDPSGNVFGDTQGNMVQEYPAGGGAPVFLGSGLSVTFGLASDSKGNIYVADAGNNQIVEFQKSSSVSPPPPQTDTSVISYFNSGPATPRNNYSGFVGFAFTVGATPVQVSWLGRFVLTGNTGTHLLKLVQANGVDLPGGSITLATAGANTYQFDYAALASPVTLLANSTYYLVSQETAGGDQWLDYSSVTSSNAVTILGPSYTDSSSHYVTVGGAYNYAYVPVSFLYSNATSTAPLAVTITSPVTGGTYSNTIPITVSTTGAVASLQVQVDGVNVGAAVPVSYSAGPVYTLSLNTTTLSNGLHSLTVVASDAQSNTATSPAISITVNNATVAATSFVTGESLGPLRTNYNGFVGFQMKIGSTPVVVTFLGRYVAPGDSRTHLLQLVNANGQPVAGGSVSISLSGATPGQFSYGALPAPLTLQANTSYFLVSQEAGYGYDANPNPADGDPWYNLGPVTTTSVASVTAPVYTDGNGNYVPVSGSTGYSYVPVSFLYESSSSLNVNITSPQSGAQLSGSSVPVTVSTTGTVTSLQLQVDGVNQGAPVSAGPLTLNTTTIGNGQHTLTVVASNGTTATATSPGIPVVINNGGGVVTTTAFITGETPSTLRNNYSGFVGMSINVGSNAITVSALGRLFAAGNSGTHILKLVQTNGTDVPGGSVTVTMTGGTAGQFVYGTLASPIALLANTTYYVMSQETAGGDNWYNFEPVTGTNAASIVGPVYTDGHGNYVFVPGFPNQCYVPLSFEYQ